MREEAINETIALFPYLIDEYGFVIQQETYMPEYFGSFFITLLGKDFRVRFVKDRIDLWADVGPIGETEDWTDVRVVLEFLAQKEGKEFTEIEISDMKTLSEQFKSNYEKIQSFFDKRNFPELKKELEEYEFEQAEKRFGIKLKR